MSEFSSPSETPITAQRPPSLAPQDRLGWINRPIWIGLSLPWLVGTAVVVLAAGWYLFAPEQPSTVDALAFGDENVIQPVASSPKPPSPVDTGFGVAQAQQDLAEVIGGVRSYAEANRAGIERLAQTSKAQIAQIAVLQEQLVEVQGQNSLLSARLSSLEGKPRVTSKPIVKTVSPPPASSPLAGMRLSSVQVGMAWVYWQDKTWAVQVGDSIGPVVVTAIDPASRQVHTSSGTIK